MLVYEVLVTEDAMVHQRITNASRGPWSKVLSMTSDTRDSVPAWQAYDANPARFHTKPFDVSRLDKLVSDLKDQAGPSGSVSTRRDRHARTVADAIANLHAARVKYEEVVFAAQDKAWEKAQEKAQQDNALTSAAAASTLLEMHSAHSA